MAANYGDAVYAGAGGGSGAVARGESRAAEFDPGHRGRSTDYGVARFRVDRSANRRDGAWTCCARWGKATDPPSENECGERKRERCKCRDADAQAFVAPDLPQA